VAACRSHSTKAAAIAVQTIAPLSHSPGPAPWAALKLEITAS
jgi:hypothetical protein